MRCYGSEGALPSDKAAGPNGQVTPSEERSVSDAPPLVGKVVGGKYRIIKLLGEGGMGAVFLGEFNLGPTVKKVAVKTLHAHLSHDPKIVARFERECATVAELQHPNTIQVHDFGKTDDGTLYIVMEYVEGRSVAEILEQEGPMDPPRVLKIMRQVCGSLAEAHSRGIVHRDLKPDNVVLCERAGQKDWVEVLDFGIAKRSNEHDPNEQKLTQQGMVLGTPPYMSPEQFTGKPIDARSDIYSLGVMAYEMLTGRLPFSGNTAWEWATQHMTARPVAIESLPAGTRVPAGMRNAINRALSKQPEERFDDVTGFIDAFDADVAAGAATPAPAPADGRQKTEMATPMQAPPGVYAPAPMAPAPMHAPTPMGPAPGPAMAAPGYGTPASGHQAFAAASTESKGLPRGLIFGAIAVLGIGSIVAVLAGLGVFKSNTPTGDPNVFGGTTTAAPPPTVIPTTPTAPTETTPTAATTAVKPLDPVKTPTPVGKTTKPATSTATTPSTPTPPTPPPPPTTVTPPPPPPPTTVTPPPPPPPKPKIAECDVARKFCNHPAAGTDKSIQNLCVTNKQACFAKGGTL